MRDTSSNSVRQTCDDSLRSNAARRIREHTACARPTLCPELQLHLATPATVLWRCSEAEARTLGFSQPYWAFCWPGGQAIARWLLDNAEDLTGYRVLDFGSGGGVAGIAAALRGADVTACDIDPLAAVAARLNAELNGVRLHATTEPHIGRYEAWDWVLAGDVTYDATLCQRVLPWLHDLAKAETRVILADPGRGYLTTASMRSLGSYDAPSDHDGTGAYRVATTVFELLRQP